jgi:hypothetical protein
METGPMSDQMDNDDAWFDEFNARKDAEDAARLNVARQEAEKVGKEPFSAQALSRYYAPRHRSGADQGTIVKALAEYESAYYLSCPEIRTLEEFGAKLGEGYFYDW